MPGGGLFSLVSYGAQNVLLSGNPDFTFFYKTYKKYSHFAEESVTQVLDGPQELFYNQPIYVRAKIQRLGDLVRDMYLTFNIPDIYSKYYDVVTNEDVRNSQYNFRWVRYLGCSIIQNIAFFIGGQKIQEFDGNYIAAKAQADLGHTEFQKWRKLVGDVPEVMDPAHGKYAAGGSADQYPIVYPYPSTTVPNANRPSIPARTISVPIPFWFEESTFSALPLIALQQHETEIHITLRSIQELYQIYDPSGNIVRPGFIQHPNPDPSQPMNPYYTATSTIADVTIDNFLTDWGHPKPLLLTWQLNPRIQTTYVYLTEDERKQFAKSSLQYLVRQVTSYEFLDIFSRSLEELRTHNPINRLIIVPRRNDAIRFRNDYANYTNWIDKTRAPTNVPLPYLIPPLFPVDATGLLIPIAGQRSILQTLRILGDGNELQEEKPIGYFTQNVSWKYLKGDPNDEDLIVYPFGLHSPGDQPDGSINSSRIRLLQIDLNTNTLPQQSVLNTSGSFYAYNIMVYVENLNWVNIGAGLGGLAYAL